MARETKIVQCYPSDEAIEFTIKEWESFGWEMTDNQRYSDKSEATIPFTGGKEVTTTTYNKITFSREKSQPWHEEVCNLEEEYEKLCFEQRKLRNGAPGDPKYSYAMFLLVIIPPPFIWFAVHYFSKKAKYKKLNKKYFESIQPKLDELEGKKEALRKMAEKLVG